MNTKSLTSPRKAYFHQNFPSRKLVIGWRCLREKDLTVTLRPLAKTVQGCRPSSGLVLSYALDRLFLVADNTAPTSSVLSFQSATAVANYFGVTS